MDGIATDCNDILYQLVGPVSDCTSNPNGTLTQKQCNELCPTACPESCNANGTPDSCSVSEQSVDAGGYANGTVLDCNYGPCTTGRRPAGLAPAAGAASREAGEVACYLAEAAHLEAASVVAFDQLARELSAHGAPEGLVCAARRAAREEERHARAMGRLAERAGARPRPVDVEAAPVRSLEAIAVDNAVEGCVREAFGAVVAMRQAVRARSGEVRGAMRRIAREEAGHAALAWALARWLDEQLDAEGRARVREARGRAVEALAREMDQEPGDRRVAELGLPTAAEARAAIGELRASLWAA
jgi:hypothetical protein